MALVSEPFLPTILSHNLHPTAYPFTRDVMYTPFTLFTAWTDPDQDDPIKNEVARIREAILKTLVEEGYEDVSTSPLYPNYSAWDAPLERIYGKSLPKMQQVKHRADPDDVMGLAGGFKVSPKAAIRDEL